MLNFISKLFGGSKSEKDVKKITPVIAEINKYFQSYASLSNDQLRNNTTDFKRRIQEHVSQVSAEIADMKAQAETVAKRLADGGAQVDPQSEMVALIAYLQRLGTDIKHAPKEEIEGSKPQADAK